MPHTFRSLQQLHRDSPILENTHLNRIRIPPPLLCDVFQRARRIRRQSHCNALAHSRLGRRDLAIRVGELVHSRRADSERTGDATAEDFSAGVYFCYVDESARADLVPVEGGFVFVDSIMWFVVRLVLSWGWEVYGTLGGPWILRYNTLGIL